MKRIALVLQETVALRLTVLQGVQDYARTRLDWQLVRAAGSLVLPWDEALAAAPDGFIGFVGVEGLPMKDRLKAPVVCVNSIRDEVDAIRVRSDSHDIGRMAAKHFLELGYERFAYATDVPDYYYSRRRLEGYQFALRAAGKDAAEIQLSPNLEDFEKDANAIGGIANGTALYCVTDGCARRVLTLCEELAIRVPSQLAVLGTDNDPFHCEGGRTLLSSIDVNHRQVGFMAAETLNNVLDGNAAPADAVEVPPIGVLTRTSTDPVEGISHPIVVRALKVISKHFRDPAFTTERLAEQCGVSTRTISRLFGQNRLESPYRTLLHVRLAAAKQQLVQPGRTAEEIAFSCGFSDYSSFFRVFKSHAGVAPSAFR